MKQIIRKLASGRLEPVPDDPQLPLAQTLELRESEARGQLSANDERIAAFLRDHLDGLAFHTADSLAQGAGVSAAAVVRFARRLGFASFRELRDLAREELRAAPVAERTKEGEASALQRKAQRDVASIELLPHLLGERLAEAAALLAAAPSVWLLAGRETEGLAVYAHRLLHHARPGTRLVDPSFPDDLRDAGAGDAVLAISFRPYARQTVSLLAAARRAGAGVVLISDGQALDFIDPADVVLAVPVESPTPFLSLTPALCAIEALIAAVAELDADRTYETLEKTAEFADGQSLMLERNSPVAPGEPPPGGTP